MQGELDVGGAQCRESSMWLGLNVGELDVGGLNAGRAQCRESSMQRELNVGRARCRESSM